MTISGGLLILHVTGSPIYINPEHVVCFHDNGLSTTNGYFAVDESAEEILERLFKLSAAEWGL